MPHGVRSRSGLHLRMGSGESGNECPQARRDLREINGDILNLSGRGGFCSGVVVEKEFRVKIKSIEPHISLDAKLKGASPVQLVLAHN